jgi:preprotein translocase SecE subunit
MSAWGLYKSGQGYWVRVMTAAAIAIMTFATAGWIMGQMNVLSTKLPVRSWVAEVSSVSGGGPKVGDRVAMTRVPSGASRPETIGTARVVSYDPTSSLVKISDFQSGGALARAEDATAFATTEGGGGFGATVKNNVRGLPMINSTILQGIAAIIVLLCGAGLAYFLCGAKAKTVDFLISTDMEMKKVAWSTRRDITTSTLVVVGASFLLAGVLFGIDVTLQFFFRAINVLQ